MPYIIKNHDTKKIIEVIYNKDVDFDTRIRALSDVINIIKKDGIKRNLLIDVCNIKSLMSTIQEYDFGEKLANCKELRGCNVALLRTLQNNENKFINTVAINRGYFLKEFISRDEALSWLQVR